MVLVRRIARPLLASIFVYGGIDALRHPEGKAPKAEKVLGALHERIPGINSTEQLVRADAAVKIVAGSTLALGKFPRLSSLALVASLVPTTLAGHRFWEETDPTKKKMQQLQFAKNASILGGVILAAVDTEGKPSLGWRTRRAARDLKRSATSSSHKASGLTDEIADRAREGAHSVAGFAQSAGSLIAEKAHTVADSATHALQS